MVEQPLVEPILYATPMEPILLDLSDVKQDFEELEEEEALFLLTQM